MTDTPNHTRFDYFAANGRQRGPRLGPAAHWTKDVLQLQNSMAASIRGANSAPQIDLLLSPLWQRGVNMKG